MKLILADKTHNRQLCQISRKLSIPGSIQVAYGRDPNFFTGLCVQGKFNQVVAGFTKNEIAGFGCRSVKPVYINGKKIDFGYLSGLKLIPKYQKNIHLARGFKFFKKLHQDNRTPAYLTTIIEDNDHARKILESGKAGLPTYTDCGRYFSHAIFLNKKKKIRSVKQKFDIRRAEALDIQNIIEFLNREGKKRQFFPVYSITDFVDSKYTKGFSINDFYLAVKEDGKIVGTIGKWDQREYKQHIITGYKGWLKSFKLLIDKGLNISGYKPLPEPGSEMNMFFTSFIRIKDDDPDILRALIERIYHDNRHFYHYFMIGFHETDPLLKSVKSFVSISYKSRLYMVCYDDGLDAVKKIRNIVPYLELGTL